MVALNSEGKLVDRPLSPHLQVYRWPISMALSILHRVTGVGLAFGTLILTWWLVATAGSDIEFDRAQHFIGSVPGLLILFVWSVALIFHFFSGIRHLFWDLGIGFGAPTSTMSGWAVLVATGAFTTVVWLVGLLVR
ncbi:succinate dehydrogenase, cytochrome b556 subunit [Rhodopila sp.]|uniref:succinate dehydrogenase, cytochrome b556 subunit n=1 Tax=Rhodopila sp. TaxID=2480087 RepID=UPI003D11ADEB